MISLNLRDKMISSQQKIQAFNFVIIRKKSWKINFIIFNLNNANKEKKMSSSRVNRLNII